MWRRGGTDDRVGQGQVVSDGSTAKRGGRDRAAGESVSEEWDTPGFRLFKLLAIASYLISLLWAIIALLVLYLRSRIAQREREKASSFPAE
jgi:hypothetical protein